MPIQYYIHLVILCEIYILLGVGFLIVLGWGGIFSLAQISLFGIGAYTVAVLTTDYSYSTWTALFLAPLTSTVVALLIGALSLRLKSDYFAIGSLAFALMTQALMLNWKSVTHGVLGIPGIPRPEFWGVVLDENAYFMIVTTIVTVVAVLVIGMLRRSALGRALLAQSEFDPGLSALGISPTTTKIAALCVSAVITGLAGGLFALYISFIDPSSFSLPEMVFLVAIVVVGGLKSSRYVIFSAIGLVLIPEALTFISLPSSVLGPLRQFFYASILFAIVYMKRATIFPARRSL